MKNIEKYKNNIQRDIYTCGLYQSIYKIKNGEYTHDCCGVCDRCYDDCIRWLAEESKEPVLDDVERKYLQEIIKPFKNYVTGITKIKDDYEKGKQYIRIIVKKYTHEYINLPYFEENTMYKGMKENKKYSLEELDL